MTPNSDTYPAERSPSEGRVSQADRRARTREALLRAAAAGLSRYGYSDLTLERVAKDAGFTRGALYHQFKNKEDLTLAVLAWTFDLWDREVRPVIDREAEPTDALFALARAHAAFFRHDIARVAYAMGLEFTGRDHPVGRAVEEAQTELTTLCVDLVRAGRANGSIPTTGSSDRIIASAAVGALEGVIVALKHDPPHNEIYAVRALAGVLGVEPPK